MGLGTFKKRIATPEKLDGNIIIEALSVSDPQVMDQNSVGFYQYYFEIFDRTKSYTNGTGLTLSKNVLLTADSLYEPLDVWVVEVDEFNGISESDRKQIFTKNPVSRVNWLCKAMLQTTAMDAAKQYQVNTADTTKLRLTLSGSSAELSTGTLSQILSTTQKLLVRYRVTPTQIDWS